MTIVALTFASPVPATDVDGTASKSFRLKTQNIKGRESFAPSQRFNNEYLIAYHTGAALNVGTVVNNRSEAIVGHFNGTRLQFDLGVAPYRYPYYMSLPGPDDFYAGRSGPSHVPASH